MVKSNAVQLVEHALGVWCVRVYGCQLKVWEYSIREAMLEAMRLHSGWTIVRLNVGIWRGVVFSLS